MRSCITLLAGFTLVGCGSSPPPPAEPPVTRAPASEPDAGTAEEKQADAAPPEQASLDGVPGDCTKEGSADGVCVPPHSFVERLCGGFPQPDIALLMFRKGSPWTRAYINRDVEAWYTSGRQSTKAKLVFDEEVLVLRHPKQQAGGMVVGSGAAPFDVIRWDGVCASLGGEEVTLKRPPAPKRPSIPWGHLENNVRDALLADATVAKAEQARRKECKGSTGLGMMTPACVKADDKLSAAIVDFVTKGGETPFPTGRR